MPRISRHKALTESQTIWVRQFCAAVNEQRESPEIGYDGPGSYHPTMLHMLAFAMLLQDGLTLPTGYRTLSLAEYSHEEIDAAVERARGLLDFLKAQGALDPAFAANTQQRIGLVPADYIVRQAAAR